MRNRQSTVRVLMFAGVLVVLLVAVLVLVDGLWGSGDDAGPSGQNALAVDQAKLDEAEHGASPLLFAVWGGVGVLMFGGSTYLVLRLRRSDET